MLRLLRTVEHGQQTFSATLDRLLYSGGPVHLAAGEVLEVK